MMPMMAAGLGSILFAINIDNPDLNAIKPAAGLDIILSSTPPGKLYAPRIEEEPRPVIPTDMSPKGESPCVIRDDIFLHTIFDRV